MRLAQGPRPWSIWLFSGVTTYLAAMQIWVSLDSLGRTQITFENLFPFVGWSEDLVVVTASALFTIDMIPVILVLLFASRFARWFISAMAAAPLLLVLTNIEYASTYPRFLGPSVLNALIPIVLAALLWSRSANRYFAKDTPDLAPSA